MPIKNYLQEKQQIVYKTLLNSFKNNKTSHAYIIAGSKGAPVLDTAIFMAQSFICNHSDENKLACEECINCKKIENRTYADFKIFSGDELKTDATLSLQEEFNKSAIEPEGIKIYIVDLIEKAPVSSLNKLLKFIEEPTSNIIAIFTSNSISSILPTIVSRCQVITLKEFMVKDLAQYLIKQDIPESDAWLISKISNNTEKNLEVVKSESYKEIKEVLERSLNYLANKDEYFIVYMEIEGLKKISDSSLIELFLDMLETCLMEAIIKKEDVEYVSKFYDEETSKISTKFNHIDYMINDITNAKIDLLSYANKALVFDKLLINLLRR